MEPKGNSTKRKRMVDSGMNKTVRRVWNGFTTALVALTMLLALLLVGARAVGLQVFAVLSGSMEPAYPTGSLIYVKRVEPDRVEVGQVISFVMNESLTAATHRVIGIDAQRQLFYTKGDANQAADGAPVHFHNLLGIPVFAIPRLGYLAHAIQHPPGKPIAIGAGALLLLLVFLQELLQKQRAIQPSPAAAPAVKEGDGSKR